MKQFFFTLVVLAQIVSMDAYAQKVPDNVLGRFIKTYSDDGFKLEKTILPDFKRAHPGNLIYYNNCYPGKSIVVLTVTAGKPADWNFKVSYGNQVAPKTHQLTEITMDDSHYYTDWIIARFPSSFSDHSENCLTIVAYDNKAIDLPVYMYIFSKQN